MKHLKNLEKIDVIVHSIAILCFLLFLSVGYMPVFLGLVGIAVDIAIIALTLRKNDIDVSDIIKMIKAHYNSDDDWDLYDDDDEDDYDEDFDDEDEDDNEEL